MNQIDGVSLSPLKVVKDERGAVMHLLRSDAPHYKGVNEIYFSVVNPGVTKGWKKHSTVWCQFAVPIGKLRFVLHDMRDSSPTTGEWLDVELSPENYQLLVIPPGVAYAWRCVSVIPAYLANCSSELWRQDEVSSISFEQIVYPEW